MKILIITACLINHRDDKGGIAYDEGAMPDVIKDDARVLTEAGRALYLSKDDDHTKEKRYTADAALIAAAKADAKAKA